MRTSIASATNFSGLWRWVIRLLQLILKSNQQLFQSFMRRPLTLLHFFPGSLIAGTKCDDSYTWGYMTQPSHFWSIFQPWPFKLPAFTISPSETDSIYTGLLFYFYSLTKCSIVFHSRMLISMMSQIYKYLQYFSLAKSLHFNCMSYVNQINHMIPHVSECIHIHLSQLNLFISSFINCSYILHVMC